MLACFKGKISAKVNSLQQQLQRTDIISQLNNKQQVKKLNNLESQAWLYEGILERLGADPCANHEKIARTLEALEYKRSEILQELEPRRPRSYQALAELQNSVRIFLASQAEKDYEQLQKILTNLVFFARSRKASQIVLSEVINKLAAEIAKNTNQISPYRLRLAYRIDELMRVISTKLVLGYNDSTTDSNYQSIIQELRSRITLLSKEFNNLLKVNQYDKNDLERRINEISNLSKNISDLHREISNRDVDIVALQENIQNLTKTIQDKQIQINNLQNTISKLKINIQDVTEIDQENQNCINNLQSQLSKLSQEKSELQNKLRNISAYTQIKISEIEELQTEKSLLKNQKSDIEQQYRNLYQRYQQQNDEIANLKKQLDQAKRSTYTYSSSQQPQKTNNPIATERKISVEEYQKIANQSDYEYVKPYYRKDGTPVSGYYRRRRSK
ncbi:hypothetical protein H6G06_15880 [Anabaena sphaerica FACHB-251]|uniref:Uncharacterized protein n=1 Tax=Anabaena sphaerica FACHB-251 TaxID=2692883 RepID=A0A927A2V5_9NOST|nr:hypothetical protein [Anabaena sphaerica]MBD2294920.1 hypothetical protein [Anabaena sphaerica FACHB-251]